MHKAQAEYIYWLKQEQSTLKQRARINWAEEGDSNSKYFHSIIKQRRRRSQLLRIKNNSGQGNLDISEAPVDHFTEKDIEEQEGIFRNVEPVINEDMIQETPSEEEVKDAVFSINPDSTAGPDGYNAFFFQHSWEVIKTEICDYVRAIFNGASLNRFFHSVMPCTDP